MIGFGRVTDQPATPAYRNWVLVLLAIVYAVNFIDRQILSILAVDIKADLNLTDKDLGFLAGAAFAVFYALFGIPLGRLADNWNRKKLLTTGLALWSTMTALSGLATDKLSLSLARMGVGVGEASAGKFSAEGLTVNGRGFKASTAAPTQAGASAPKK